MSGAPGKLTYKQDIAIEHTVEAVKDGTSLEKATLEAVNIAYSPKNKETARVMASENLSKPTYRDELIQRLKDRGIIGKNSKVERVLDEGLEATKRVGKHIDTDYSVRLAYAQELNKITGVYAPSKHESKSTNLNVNVTADEAAQRLRELENEAEDADIIGHEEE